MLFDAMSPRPSCGLLANLNDVAEDFVQIEVLFASREESKWGDGYSDSEGFRHYVGMI